MNMRRVAREQNRGQRVNTKLQVYFETSARPEVRGTADVGWRSLNPLPINPPRTHSRLYHHMCLRPTGGDGHEWRETRTLRCAPF